MLKVFTTMFSLAVCSFGIAQNSQDEAAINKQVDAMVFSWNNHDYEDLKNYTTENTDWVNVVGMWWKGRRESQYAHQAYHKTMFKTTVCEKKSVAIRFLTPDVAIAHVIWHFSNPVPAPPLPDGKIPGPTYAIAQLVYVRQNGNWLMAAGENVTIDKDAAPYDPIKQMPKDRGN